MPVRFEEPDEDRRRGIYQNFCVPNILLISEAIEKGDIMKVEEVQQKLIYYRNIMLFMLIFPCILIISLRLLPGISLPRIVVTILVFIHMITIVVGLFMFLIWKDDIRTIGKNIEFLREFNEECERDVSIHSYSPFSDFTSGSTKTIEFSTSKPSLPNQFRMEFNKNAGNKAWLRKKQNAKWHQYPFIRLSVDFESEPKIAIIHGEIKTEDEQTKQLLKNLDLNDLPYPYIISVQKISGFGGMPKGNQLACDVYDYPPKTEDILTMLRAMHSITDCLYPDHTIDWRPKQGWGMCRVGSLTFCGTCDRFIEIWEYKGTKLGPCSVCGDKLSGKMLERLNQ